MASILEVRDAIERAAAFARGFDFTAAVARARYAVRIARDADARDEATLALDEFEAEERAWRAGIEARGRTYSAEELAAAEVDDLKTAAVVTYDEQGRRRSTTQKLLARLRREEREALT